MILLLLLLPVLIWRAWVFWDSIPLLAEGAAPRVVAGKPVYVAVLGVDERENDAGRSDTLMLVRLDPGTQAVDVVNIPRDTLVTFASGKQSKINSAYTIDGPEFVTEVISDLLGIPRPYYMVLNFKAFEEIVTQLGGVDIDVERHYQYEDPYQNLSIDIPPGRRHMDGETALKYVRLRYDGASNSDIARIERQQQFIKALRDKAVSLSAVTKVPSMVRTLRKYVRTNVPEGDQVDLALTLFGARNNMVMQTLPGGPDDATGDYLLDAVKWKEVTRAWATK